MSTAVTSSSTSTAMTAGASHSVLICAMDVAATAAVKSCVDSRLIHEFSLDLEKLMEGSISPEPQVLIFGSELGDISLNELAQVTRMAYPKLPIYFVTSDKTKFNVKDLKKNGFTETYLLPLDADILKQTLQELAAQLSKDSPRTYRRVSLVDIAPEESLDFDTYLYLAANRKHVRISAAGDSIDQSQYNRLTLGQVNSIHVSTDQIQKFYTYSGKKLSQLQNGAGISETERKEKLQSAVRNLISSVFDVSHQDTIEVGRSMVSDCQEIVKQYILAGGDQNAWYEKVSRAVGAEGGVYNHAGNVATFAALFSLALGKAKPEECALAGLLHDMGKAELPSSLAGREPEDLTEQEDLEYRKHVDLTLNLIKFRKMILPETVLKAIVQHHERWGGTGYPKGLAGSRICIEAQILALADQFDYLTMTRDGETRMGPREAIQVLVDQNNSNPAVAAFDPELLGQLQKLFQP